MITMQYLKTIYTSLLTVVIILCGSNSYCAGSDLQLKEMVTFTYEAIDQPLQQIISRISKATGVDLKVSANADQWQVRERTATVFAHDVHLDDFMQSVADMFGYKWQKSEDENKHTTYLLVETQSVRTSLGKQLDDKEKAKQSLRLNVVNAALSAAQSADELRDDQIGSDQIWLNYLHNNKKGKLWAKLLRSLPDSLWDSVAKCKDSVHMNIAHSNLSRETIDCLNDILELPESSTSVPECREVRINEACGIEFNSLPFESSYGTIGHLYILVNTGENSYGAAERIPLATPESPDSLLTAYKELGYKDADVSKLINAYCKELDKKNATEDPLATQKKLLEEMPHSPISIADLIAEEKYKSMDKVRRDIYEDLRGLEKESGNPIIFESFDYVEPQGVELTSDKRKIVDIVHDLERSDKAAVYANNFLLFRYRNCLNYRALEIPKLLIMKWKALAIAHNGLDYPILLDIVRNASYDQCKEYLAKVRFFDKAGMGQFLVNPVLYRDLRICSFLDNQMLADLLSEKGLLLSTVKNAIDESDIDGLQKMYVDSYLTKDPLTRLSIIITDDKENRDNLQSVQSMIRFSDGTTDTSGSSLKRVDLSEFD